MLSIPLTTRRLLAGLLSTSVVVLLTMFMLASPASAAMCEVEQKDGSLKLVDCDTLPGNGGGDGGTGGGAPACTVKPGDTGCWNGESCYIKDPAEYGEDDLDSSQLPTRPGEEFHTAFRLCNGDEGGVWFWVEDDEPSQEELATQAFGELVAPAITPTFNPPVRTLVNLPTWWWAAGATGEALTATAGSVTVTATPSRMEIDPGNGSAVLSCLFVTQQSDTCSYAYPKASRGKDSAFPARMRLVWTVVFTDTDAPIEVPNLPTTFETPWSGVDVPVREIQTLSRPNS